MEFRKNITIIILLIVVLICVFSCKKKYDILDYQPLDSGLKNYIFTSGSTWIYKSDTGLIYDTIKCTETIKDSIDYIFTTYKEDRVYYILEYYKMSLTHSIDNKKETHYFYTSYDKLNSTINNNLIVGQCVLLIDNRNEILGFDGFINLMDTTININTINYICEHNQIIANEQILPVYNYNTDLYFAKNIGLVRKKDIINGWNLISYNITPIKQ